MGIITWQDNSLISKDEWRGLRNKTLGASEVSAVVFGSKWTSNLEIWYNKVTGSINKNYNIRMFLGHKTEGLSEEMWTCYDGTEQSVVDNSVANTPVKKCINLNSTAFNSDFPHLSATPDRTILPWGKYSHKSGNGALEIKNTMSYVLKSYASGLPLENVIQLVVQLMCCGYDYGELFYFIDNCKFQCHPIEKKETKGAQDVILKETEKFWKSVIAGRKIYNQLFEAKRTFNMKLAAKLEVELAALEPDPQTTVGYLNFLEDRYKDRVANIGMITGNSDQLIMAREHRKADAAIKKLDNKKLELEIKLKTVLKDHVIIDFGKDGRVTNFPNKNGLRLFKNLIK